VTVDYGDGSDPDTDGVVGEVVARKTPSRTFAFSHAYTAIGTYTVTVRVSDDDGGTTTVSRTIEIKAVDLQTDPDDPTKTALVVGGTNVRDVIQFTKSLSAIAVSINGAAQGFFSPTGRIIVFGQEGDDSIQVGSTITLATELYGNAGADSLAGGGGTNLLLGGDGNDTLTGGNGRDLLIGGAGADTLNGLGGDDILIGGSTAYDASAAALRAILKEWAGSAAYTQRVSNIGSGAFYNGTVRLGAGTVINDAAIDTLSGNLGDDWFFSSAGDVVKDKGATEILSPA
jgi:Ca2+-binding RTX toxin-like protein